LDEAVYLDKIRAAGFERVEVVSREHSDVGEGTEWDEVQVIVTGGDGQDAVELLAEAGLSPRDLVAKVASIKVKAYRPA
jgi:hypothetical protein